MRTLLVLLVIAMAGCSVSERPSPIVKKAEAAGAGDLSTTSALAMQSWLESRRDIAADIDRMCTPVRANAPAKWPDTTEGRLCTAARNVAVSTFKPLESDHNTYESGWK
jgi:hypothetical protein